MFGFARATLGAQHPFRLSFVIRPLHVLSNAQWCAGRTIVRRSKRDHVTVEAERLVLERLCGKLVHNAVTNVSVVPEAVSAGVGELAFIAPAAGNMGHGRIAGDAEDAPPASRQINIAATTLDAVVAADRLQRLGLVEIDPEALEEIGRTAHTLSERLGALGFRLLRATPGALKPLDGHIPHGGDVNVIALACDTVHPR